MPDTTTYALCFILIDSRMQMVYSGYRVYETLSIIVSRVVLAVYCSHTLQLTLSLLPTHTLTPGRRQDPDHPLRLPHEVRRWTLVRLRPYLREHRERQEVRAAVQTRAQRAGEGTSYSILAKHERPLTKTIRNKENLTPHHTNTTQQLNSKQKAREGSRKQIKEKKNRDLKVWGVGRRIARHKAKKANA